MWKIQMELVWWEIRKIGSLVMLPVFLGICLVLNGLTILGDVRIQKKEYVQFVAEVTKKFGGVMGETFDRRLEERILQEEEAALNGRALQAEEELLNERVLQEEEAALNGRELQAEEAALNGRELQAEEELLNGRILQAETAGRKDIFEGYSTAELGQTFVDGFGMSGIVKLCMERKYRHLQDAVDRLAAEDASLSLAAAGATKEMADFLLGDLCRLILIEGMCFAAMTALYTCGRERLSRTGNIVYATRAGRHIQLAKYAAGFCVAILAYGILAVLSMEMYALVWRPEAIWNGNISTQFYYVGSGLGSDYPFLVWKPFTIAGYLRAVLFFGVLVTALFYGIGFLAGLLMGNAYRGFLAVFVIFVLNFWGLALAGDARLWEIYALLWWTPMGLWWSLPGWFTDMGINALVPWQECAVGVVDSLVLGGMLWMGFSRFFRKNI